MRIIRGMFKGHIGIVKDATETVARVELHSMYKTVNADKTDLAMVGGERLVKERPTSTYSGRTPLGGSTGGATPMYGSRTPMHGSQTPMYGSQTPLHDAGGRTPHLGAMTPRADGGHTPRAGAGAFDPAGATPAHNQDMDYFETSPASEFWWRHSMEVKK